MDIFVLEMGENAVRNDVFSPSVCTKLDLSDRLPSFQSKKVNANYLFPQPVDIQLLCNLMQVLGIFFVSLIVCLRSLFGSERPGYDVNFYGFPYKVAPQALRDL